MNGQAIPIVGALVIQAAVALGVFFTNRHRKANQTFLVLSLAMTSWLASLYFGSTSRSLPVVVANMRIAFASATLILLSLNLLRKAIREPGATWRGLLQSSRIWIGTAIFLISMSMSDFLLTGARFSNNPTLAPQPIYGSGVYLYGVLFTAGLLALVVSSVRDLKGTSGSVRSELAYLLLASTAILILTLGAYQILRFFVEPSQLFWFAPVRAVLFSFVVAYGIATRKLMDVGLLMRRLMSYVVLIAYLLATYGAVWWIVAAAAETLFHSSQRTVAYVLAALIIALAMAPARGFSQRLADKLFIGSRGLDFRATMGKAAAILESVTTLHDLLRRFATTIAEAVGTDRVTIYVAGKRGEFIRRYPREGDQPARLNSSVSPDGPLVHYLNTHREPLILDELHRIRPTPFIEQVRRRLEELKVAAALGIFAREQLAGIMLLGPRLSGRIYGTMEQDALQLLCGQLAVAIENAELFTEVQNAKIYNETLLRNLTTGVVAADTDGKITVFNQEAEQITGLARVNRGRIIDDLPAPLRTIIRTTLATGERQEDREVSFQVGEEEVYVRASSAIFRGQEHELLGALMVITDITTLKKMEEQIRRTDRLASLGTLSAGMAHEIKNPLVSIKTFAQLLPERYAESDFRETFSGLIVHEINRIDTLVNQLLRFARPTKPLLRPMHVHETLEKTLLLVQHRLYQKEIKVNRAWNAATDMIRADSDQLEQVFLNFFLNAMDAMKRGGELTVETEIRKGEPLLARLSGNGAQATEALCISIRDTGEGIKPGDIAHVFDPFFTTKDHGTGLGLSVVHGIVQEHGGQIEVESELSKGTVFRILMPLTRDAEEAAAA